MLSGSKELEPGTRAMMLLAEGLFRFDVVISGDTLRTVIRNLSTGLLEIGGSAAGDVGPGIAFGNAAEYEPGKATIEFWLGQGGDRVAVKVTVGTLRLTKRGTVRITVQAIVRQAPAG